VAVKLTTKVNAYGNAVVMDGNRVVATMAGCDSKEALALAELFARAPALLDAAQRALNVLAREDHWRDVLVSHEGCKCDWCDTARRALGVIAVLKAVTADVRAPTALMEEAPRGKGCPACGTRHTLNEPCDYGLRKG
jgi:hypothetical protein